MKTSDFDYNLPPEMIAQRPVEPRDSSRLLVVHRDSGQLEHRRFTDIADYLRPGDLMIANDSRVIPARLFGHKPSGGRAEIFLLRPLPGPKSSRKPFGPSAGNTWLCLVGGKRLRPGSRVIIDAPANLGLEITATILDETADGGRIIRFAPPVGEWLEQTGQTPLPPYIHETLDDPERYQTVFSRQDGSVAAPTAGLHFTPELLIDLRRRGVNLGFVTLHIGLDTFQPVRVEAIDDHPMHSEWATLTADVARRINDTTLAGCRIIAVGTTSVRTLEWAATGAQGLDPYDFDLCPWKRTAAFDGPTDLFIRPGYRFRAVDLLLTNFHLPRSTLLMLVSAFAGKNLIDRAYGEAIGQGYRFYSFGDAMLIL